MTAFPGKNSLYKAKGSDYSSASSVGDASRVGNTHNSRDEFKGSGGLLLPAGDADAGRVAHRTIEEEGGEGKPSIKINPRRRPQNY